MEFQFSRYVSMTTNQRAGHYGSKRHIQICYQLSIPGDSNDQKNVIYTCNIYCNICSLPEDVVCFIRISAKLLQEYVQLFGIGSLLFGILVYMSFLLPTLMKSFTFLVKRTRLFTLSKKKRGVRSVAHYSVTTLLSAEHFILLTSASKNRRKREQKFSTILYIFLILLLYKPSHQEAILEPLSSSWVNMFLCRAFL